VKPLLVIPALKEALIGSPLGYKQVITQVHSYDIFVINALPQTCVNNKNIILILGYNYSIIS